MEVKVPMDLVPDESIWELFRTVYDSREPASMHYTLPNERTLWITIVPVTEEAGECTGVVGLFKGRGPIWKRLEKTPQGDYVAKRQPTKLRKRPLTAVRGTIRTAQRTA